MVSRSVVALAVAAAAAGGADAFSPSVLPSGIAPARLRLGATCPSTRGVLRPTPKSMGASLRMVVEDKEDRLAGDDVVQNAIRSYKQAVAATLAVTMFVSGLVAMPASSEAQPATASPPGTSMAKDGVAAGPSATPSDKTIIQEQVQQRKVAKLDPGVQDKVQVFAEILSGINSAYVDTPDLDKITELGFNAMLNSLDPYTEFENPKMTDQMRTLTTGNYGGVGLAIQKLKDPQDKDEPYVYVMNSFEGYAWSAGIRPGDKILQVNGVDVANKAVGDVSDLLKGQQGTQVVVQIERVGTPGPIEKTLTRRQVPLRDVPIAMTIDDKNEVGYAKLAGFSSSAPFELRYVINKMQEQNSIKGFILDMRGNSGGLLSSAVQIADIFLPENVPVVSTKGRPDQSPDLASDDFGFKPDRTDTMYKSMLIPKFMGRAPDGSPLFSDKPLLDPGVRVVVLVDKSTASAAEIVAGAIQDHDRGVVMGQTTYGKGLVQVLQKLSGGRQLKYTSAKYYTPSGRCIQSKSYKNEEGKVGTKATVLEDKDRMVFYTDNGRPVKDGGGIEPDVKIKANKVGQLRQVLGRWDAFYRYAGVIAKDLPDGEAKSKDDTPIVTDEVYSNFRKWAMDKMGDGALAASGPYSRSLDLFTEALNEGGFNEAIPDVKVLKKHLGDLLAREFDTDKKEIRDLLEEQVRRRYVIDAQVLSWGLSIDDTVEKAVDYAEKSDLYSSVINAKPIPGAQIANAEGSAMPME